MNRRRFLELAVSVPLLAPLPTAAAGRRRSKKKGLGIVARKDGHWLKIIRQFECRWFYSWGGDKPEGVPDGVDFIPMIWGYWGDKAGIERTGAAAKKGGLKELLGFNEPDEKNQSNLSVEKALDAWPLLMQTGLRLGSPGCVHPDGEWMKAFMEGVRKRKLRVDFVTMHSYGGTDVDAFMNRLEAVHKLFRRPIWITEFAVGDWQAKTPAENRHKPDMVLRFMQRLLPKLERCSFLERYAWFPAGQDSAALGTSALFDKEGASTPLGTFYQQA